MRLEPLYQVEDFRHLLDLVNMDMCLALVPSPLYERHKYYDNIVPVNVNTNLPKRNICIITAKNTPQNLPRDELIKRIRKNMQGTLV